MPVPKKKKAKGAVRSKRSHQALKKIALNICEKCGKAVMPHKLCSFCKTYKGKEVK